MDEKFNIVALKYKIPTVGVTYNDTSCSDIPGVTTEFVILKQRL